MDELKRIVGSFRVHDPDQKPTQDDIQRLSQYTDLSVSSRSTNDWYCLLRKTQGSLIKTLEANCISSWDIIPLPQKISFPMEEYTYIIDLDNEEFITYSLATEPTKQSFKQLMQ